MEKVGEMGKIGEIDSFTPLPPALCLLPLAIPVSNYQQDTGLPQ
jgi:hypothetical protein